MSETSRVAEWSRIVAAWVGIIGALTSFVLGMRTYREREAERNEIARAEIASRQEAEKKVADEHVKTAFSVVENFHTPQFIGLRNDLIAAIPIARKECASIHGGTSPLSTQEYYTLVEYFDRAQYCVEVELCNKDVMAQLLAPYADAWWPVLGAAIEETRRNESDFKTAKPFGFGLEALATARKPIEPRCTKAVATR